MPGQEQGEGLAALSVPGPSWGLEKVFQGGATSGTVSLAFDGRARSSSLRNQVTSAVVFGLVFCGSMCLSAATTSAEGTPVGFGGRLSGGDGGSMNGLDLTAALAAEMRVAPFLSLYGGIAMRYSLIMARSFDPFGDNDPCPNPPQIAPTAAARFWFGGFDWTAVDPASGYLELSYGPSLAHCGFCSSTPDSTSKSPIQWKGRGLRKCEKTNDRSDSCCIGGSSMI